MAAFQYAMVPYPPPSPPMRATGLASGKSPNLLIEVEAICTAVQTRDGQVLFGGRILRSSYSGPTASTTD